MANRLIFPKDLFSKQEVEIFRLKELDYPNAWDLRYSDKEWFLILNEKKFRKNYVRIKSDGK